MHVLCLTLAVDSCSILFTHGHAYVPGHRLNRDLALTSARSTIVAKVVLVYSNAISSGKKDEEQFVIIIV